MKDPARDHDGRLSGIYESVNFLAVYGTLTFLAGICLYLVGRSAETGAYAAIRSLAAVLLPAIVASFVYLFNRELLDQLGRVPTGMAFVSAMAAGMAVMVILRFVVGDSTFPIAELLTSACFAVLAFSSRSLTEKHALAFYYGVLCGLLLYIILFGFPVR